MKFMRLCRSAIYSFFIVMASTVPRASEAGEPEIALGPIAYDGEIPAYFQREVEQTLIRALELHPEMMLGTLNGDCQEMHCLLDYAHEANIAAVIFARISKRDRDYAIQLTSRAVADGAAIAEVIGDCNICGQQELLDMLPAELAKLRVRTLDALAERTVAPRVVNDDSPTIPPVSTDPPEFEGSKRAYSSVGGWLAIALGVGGGGAGVALLVLDGRPHWPSCEPNLVDVNGACPNVYTTAGAGYALLGVGLAGLGVGIGLVVHHHRKHSRGSRVELAPGSLRLSF